MEKACRVLTCHSNYHLSCGYPSTHAEQDAMTGMQVIERSAKSHHWVVRGLFGLLEGSRS